MTGGMSRLEAQDASAWPIHHALARAFRGTVEPFDVYQGPYIKLPKGGRLWLITEDGCGASVYFERYSNSKLREDVSKPFPLWQDWTIEAAIDAAATVTGRKPRRQAV